MALSHGQGDGIHVPARFIPTPSTISQQAQAFLRARRPSLGANMPDPDDKAAWRAVAQRGEAGHTAHWAMLAEAHPAETSRHQLSAVALYEIAPKSMAPGNDERAILYVHGGGFISGGGESAFYAAMPIASLARTRTFSVDYRMPPDHPFPAGLDDTVEAYRWLLERYRPENIAVYGISAGGNLAPASLLKARELGLPLPAACALHSPATDLTESGDTYETNDTIDTVLQHRAGNLFLLYAGGHDLRDPLVSPAFGEFDKGFPPTVLTSGTRDLLLSSTVLLHRALRRAGIEAELHVFEAMTHAPFFGAPEEKELLNEQLQFMLGHMGKK